MLTNSEALEAHCFIPQKLGLPVQDRYQESIKGPKMFEEPSAKIQSYVTIMEFENGVSIYQFHFMNVILF